MKNYNLFKLNEKSTRIECPAQDGKGLGTLHPKVRPPKFMSTHLTLFCIAGDNS